VCCSVLQCVAVSAAVSTVEYEGWMRTYCDKLKVECVAVCVAVCIAVCVAVWCSVLSACCSVCCSVVQGNAVCGAVHCSAL